MLIDASTREKLNQYLEKNNKTINSLKISNSDKQDITDIIEWMAKDIQEKVSNLNITDSGKAKVLSDDFYMSMYRQILGNSLNMIMDGVIIEKEDQEVLDISLDLEELVTKLIILSMQKDIIAEKIVKSLASSYVGKCLELAVLPDDYITALIVQ
jgi:hypothetical protein